MRALSLLHSLPPSLLSAMAKSCEGKECGDIDGQPRSSIEALELFKAAACSQDSGCLCALWCKAAIDELDSSLARLRSAILQGCFRLVPPPAPALFTLQLRRQIFCLYNQPIVEEVKQCGGLNVQHSVRRCVTVVMRVGSRCQDLVRCSENGEFNTQLTSAHVFVNHCSSAEPLISLVG